MGYFILSNMDLDHFNITITSNREIDREGKNRNSIINLFFFL